MSLKKKPELKVPASTEAVLNPSCETVGSAENHGALVEAFPLVDAGEDSGVGHWEANGPAVKFVVEKIFKGLASTLSPFLFHKEKSLWERVRKITCTR